MRQRVDRSGNTALSAGDCCLPSAGLCDAVAGGTWHRRYCMAERNATGFHVSLDVLAAEDRSLSEERSSACIVLRVGAPLTCVILSCPLHFQVLAAERPHRARQSMLPGPGTYRTEASKTCPREIRRPRHGAPACRWGPSACRPARNISRYLQAESLHIT